LFQLAIFITILKTLGKRTDRRRTRFSMGLKDVNAIWLGLLSSG